MWSFKQVSLIALGCAIAPTLIPLSLLIRLVGQLRRQLDFHEARVCQEPTFVRDLLHMTAIHKPQPSLPAGYCGFCAEPVRHGEMCCDLHVGWISPDGLAWLSYEEYAVTVAGGLIMDCRRQGKTIPDNILALPNDIFVGAITEADVTELLHQAYEENWDLGLLWKRWQEAEARWVP